MSDSVIQTRGLTRYFGSKCAVDSVDLTVPRGCVFALLGRNGSGKTTLLRMLLGLIQPTRGSAAVLGHDCGHLTSAARGRIGYMAEGHPLYGWMRVREVGRFQSRFYPTWNDRIFRSVIDHFHLSPKAKASDLSRGERAGLSLAITLAPEPELLLLDDPMLGLDPVARRALLEAMVYVTRDSRRTILFSSHLLADVERVADRIAILDRSVLRANCSIDTFRSRVRQLVLRFADAPPPAPNIPGLLYSRRDGNELRLTIANLNGQAQSLAASLGAASAEDVPLSLEDAVIGYLGYRGERGFIFQDAGGVA